MLLPHAVSLLQAIVHQVSKLQYGVGPEPGAQAVQGELAAVEQGSPTAPNVPAQTSSVVVMGWQVVPEKDRQSEFV